MTYQKSLSMMSSLYDIPKVSKHDAKLVMYAKQAITSTAKGEENEFDKDVYEKNIVSTKHDISITAFSIC